MGLQPVVSAMLLHKPCPQRGTVFDFDACLPWADSLARQNLHGVLFVSGVDAAAAQKKMPHIVVADAAHFYPDWAALSQRNPGDARWVLYQHWIEHAHVDAAFFTDATDVIVKTNPFPMLDATTLYCGDEPATVVHPWLRDLICFIDYPEMREFFDAHPDLPLLNCGVVGGTRAVLRSFFHAFMAPGFRPSSRLLDMAFFNYAIHRGDAVARVVHGAPVTSVFKAFQDRDDVWFIHK